MKQARMRAYYQIVRYLFYPEGVAIWLYSLAVIFGCLQVVTGWLVDDVFNPIQGVTFALTMILMLSGMWLVIPSPKLFTQNTLKYLGNFRGFILGLFFVYVFIYSLNYYFSKGWVGNRQFDLIHLANSWCLFSVITAVYLFAVLKYPSFQFYCIFIPTLLVLIGILLPQLPIGMLFALGGLIWLVFSYWWLSHRCVTDSESRSFVKRISNIYTAQSSNSTEKIKREMLWNYVVTNTHAFSGFIKFASVFCSLMIVFTGIFVILIGHEEGISIPVIIITTLFTSCAVFGSTLQFCIFGNIKRCWLLADSRLKMLNAVEMTWVKALSSLLMLLAAFYCLAIPTFGVLYFSPLSMVILFSSLTVFCSFSFYGGLWIYYATLNQYRDGNAIKMTSVFISLLFGVALGFLLRWQFVSAIWLIQILLVVIALILRHKLYTKFNHADLVKIS